MEDSTKLLLALLRGEETQDNRWQNMAMSEWFANFKRAGSTYQNTIDRAFIAGRFSASVGFAFAGAYQSAIEGLFHLQDTLMASVCVTEVEGNHPRAIKTRLYSQGGELRISGSKSFVSGANNAGMIYVACRDEREGDGLDSSGRPIIKMVALKVASPGIDIEEMPPLGFVPEISHGKVSLDLAVEESLILPGDGYLDYVKAFRTYEDLHVCAAMTAYRLGEALASDWGRDFVEQHVALILSLRKLSAIPLNSPLAHIALSACRRNLDALIDQTDEIFETQNPQAYDSWKRDKRLLKVASKAHAVRTQKAWDSLSA